VYLGVPDLRDPLEPGENLVPPDLPVLGETGVSLVTQERGVSLVSRDQLDLPETRVSLESGVDQAGPVDTD